MKKGIAVFQALILIVSTVAFAYFVGAEFQIVSAAGDLCLATKSGDVIYSGGNTVKTGQWSQAQINSWCLANGAGQVCDGGSGNWQLKTISCPAPPVSTQSSPSGAVAVTAPIQQAVAAKAVDKALDKIPSIVKTRGEVIGSSSAPGTAPPLGAPKPTTLPAGPTPGQSIFSKIKSVGGYIAENAAISYGIYWGSKLALGSLGGRISPEQVEAISKAAGWGYFAGSLAKQYGTSAFNAIFGTSLSAGPIGWIVGGIVAIGVFVFSGGSQTDVVSFSCNPWSPPTGGSDCQKCNSGDFPCTEYRCKSLGQSCELVNKGTADELCTWINRQDVNPPVIQPWLEVLTPGYKYTPDNAVAPKDRGVKVVPEGNLTGCVAPYKALTFGVKLDEPGKCNIDTEETSSFDDMAIHLSSGLLEYNHSFQLSLPSPDALSAENISLVNGGQMSIYTRCQDAAGNTNVANFVINFCVDKGPDRTQPEIVTTSILNNSPISYGQKNVSLDVFVDEPATCKWSHLDKSYDDMENTMSCSTSAVATNAQLLYTCSTTLDGLKDQVDNNFYFRCKDQPYLEGTNRSFERNEMSQSYPFVLKGTQPLKITSVEPNNTKVSDSTNVIKVTLKASTIAGYKDGAATCSFKDLATPNDAFVDFYNTGTNTHSQDLYLPEGDYNFEVRCVDLGGNADTADTNFSVETDTTAPTVVRVFKQDNLLKIITNEAASCVYSNVDCNYLFNDGIKMSLINATNGTATEHSTAWDSSKNFYIKCQDKFSNEIGPGQCNIVAKPYDVLSTSQ